MPVRDRLVPQIPLGRVGPRRYSCTCPARPRLQRKLFVARSIKSTMSTGTGRPPPPTETSAVTTSTVPTKPAIQQSAGTVAPMKLPMRQSPGPALNRSTVEPHGFEQIWSPHPRTAVFGQFNSKIRIVENLQAKRYVVRRRRLQATASPSWKDRGYAAVRPLISPSGGTKKQGESNITSDKVHDLGVKEPPKSRSSSADRIIERLREDVAACQDRLRIRRDLQACADLTDNDSDMSDSDPDTANAEDLSNSDSDTGPSTDPSESDSDTTRIAKRSRLS